MTKVTPFPPARNNQLVTEDSAAQRFVALYDGHLRYCHDAKAWFEWTGVRWRQERTGVAFHWARELARDLSDSEPDRVRYVSSKTSFAAGVERFARSDPAFATTSDFWDRDPMLLGTPEGTVDLATGELRASRPDEGITKSTAIAPATHSDCPLWLRFLNEATGDDAALVQFLQQWCGYSLTGRISEHALVFIYGDGGNGKSVFLNTESRILGDYAVVSAMETFTAATGDRHPTDLAMLRGARLVWASETEEGRAWAESRLKAVTGGDPISARFMRQDFFTFQPQFKLTIIGNHRPVLRNVDDAARRRINVVPFTRKPSEPDPELEQKLGAEWPAILRWMIDGCLAWQAEGLRRSQVVIDETAEYFAEQDLIGQWLEDECDVEIWNNWKKERAADLFAAWSAFATRSGERPGTAKAFATILRKRGITKEHTKHGAVYQGIRLLKSHSG